MAVHQSGYSGHFQLAYIVIIPIYINPDILWLAVLIPIHVA